MKLNDLSKEELIFYKKIKNLKNKEFITRFLNLNEQKIIKIVIPNCELYGGTENAELKRAKSRYIEQFNIICYQVSVINKFAKIGHRDVLGSLMNLGLEKDNFGDILILDDIHVLIASEVKNYFELNFNCIGKSKIKLTRADSSKFEKKENLTEKRVISNSLRLDNLVCNVYKISRSQVKELIERGFLQINHKVVLNHSKIIKENDLVSVRTKGRFKFLKEIGKSRKEKYIILVGIY